MVDAVNCYNATWSHVAQWVTPYYTVISVELEFPSSIFGFELDIHRET